MSTSKISPLYNHKSANLSPATGFLPIVEAGYKSLAPKGTFVFIGVNLSPEYVLNIPIGAHMINGTRLLGCVEGDSVPSEVR